MKTLKYFAIIAATVLALNVTATAFTIDPCLTFLGALPFGPNNNPDTNFADLGTFVDTSGLDSTPALNIEDIPDGAPPQTIAVNQNCFIVVHFGKGNLKGGAKGGSFEFFSVNPGCTSATLPQFGGVAGNDPFGIGGISSIREFCPPGTHVPDSGTTAMLLGSALAGLGLVRRYLKR